MIPVIYHKSRSDSNIIRRIGNGHPFREKRNAYWHASKLSHFDYQFDIAFSVTAINSSRADSSWKPLSFFRRRKLKRLRRNYSKLKICLNSIEQIFCFMFTRFIFLFKNAGCCVGLRYAFKNTLFFQSLNSVFSIVSVEFWI